MSNASDRPVLSRRNPLDLGELDEDSYFRNDQFEPADERIPDRGTRNSGSSTRDLQDPFTPIPLPDRESLSNDVIDEILTVRYQNPVTLRAVRAITSGQAGQLFSEVSQKIDERSLEPTSYDVRVHRALRNLTIALDNEAFVNGLGLSADSPQLDAFRNTLHRLDDTVRLQKHMHHARIFLVQRQMKCASLARAKLECFVIILLFFVIHREAVQESSRW